MRQNHKNSLAKHCNVNKIKEELHLHESDWFLFCFAGASVLQGFWASIMTMTHGYLHWTQRPKTFKFFKRGTQSPLRSILHLLVLPSPSSKGQLVTLNTFELPHIYTTTQNPQYTPLKFKPGVCFHCRGYAPNNSLRASVGINQTSARCLTAKSLVIGAK